MKPGMADWREDIDALRFAVSDTGPYCFVHRLAFRALLGFSPDRNDCLAWFSSHSDQILSAAVARQRRADRPEQNFHLNSRDIRRQLAGAPLGDSEGS